MAFAWVDLGEPRFENDGFEEKLEVVLEERVPIVSFTFGCPRRKVFERLHERGLAGWVTVTELDEALAGEAAAQVASGQTKDHAEGVAAFLEKRPPTFQGA